MAKHMDLRKKLGIDTVLVSKTRSEDVLALAEQATRMKHAHLPAAEIEDHVRNLYTDVSQDASRQPWSCYTLRSLTTSSDIFAHGLGRKLRLRELYNLLDFKAVALEC
eukprot:4875427-Amphidinium_carterae.1